MSGKILFDIDHRFNQKLLFIFYLIFNNLPFMKSLSFWQKKMSLQITRPYFF